MLNHVEHEMIHYHHKFKSWEEVWQKLDKILVNMVSQYTYAWIDRKLNDSFIGIKDFHLLNAPPGFIMSRLINFRFKYRFLVLSKLIYPINYNKITIKII